MRRVLLAALVLVVAPALAAPSLAQPPFVVVERADGRPPLDPNDARQTRTDLQRLLSSHPPTLRIVLQADPSLLNRPDYLAPYPRLGAFLKEHPEVARDPVYFFGTPDFGYTVVERTAQERAMALLEELLVGVAVFTVVMAIVLVLGSLIRQAIEHRRWLRQSRVQTDVHSKILDRMQSNEDLLAYIQTPAGQRFLQAGPAPQQESAAPAISAPFGRILWSVQAGVMLAALGVGLWIVQRNVMEEIAPAFNAMGIIALMLGVGAIASAGLSYLLSVRFGLIGTSRS